MAKKLLEKAGLIHMPPATRVAADDPPTSARGSALGAPVPLGGAADAARQTAAAVAGAASDAEAAKPKTAPGSMLQFMTAQSAAVREAELLRERLAGFDGALPTRRLDPRLVRPSLWANRHADSYLDADFAALKADIAAAGGNVQPIKVRPVGQGVGPSNAPAAMPPATPAASATAMLAAGPAEAASAADPAAAFEIVYGHRRHQACLELGLPVLAVVDAVPEQQLFVEMERENRARKDLSAWEQGMMYARALDQGLYPSNRQLAAAIGRDLGDVGKALSLARLPLAVVQAFRSPLDLQYRWAKPLGDAQQRDPDGLVQRARALKQVAGQCTARQIFEGLLGQSAALLQAGAVADLVVRQGKRTVAVVSADSRGNTTVRFARPLSPARRQALVDCLSGFLSGGPGGQASDGAPD